MLSILRNRRRKPARRLAAAEADADAAAHALIRYRDNDRVASVIGAQAFADGLAVRQDRVRDARLAVMDARARARLHDIPPVDDVRRMLVTMTVADKRELVARAIDAVFVAPGRGPAAERVTVCPVGTGPRILPRPGGRGVMRSITPRRGWINPRA
jgi:hypothetical protein